MNPFAAHGRKPHVIEAYRHFVDFSRSRLAFLSGGNGAHGGSGGLSK